MHENRDPHTLKAIGYVAESQKRSAKRAELERRRRLVTTVLGSSEMGMRRVYLSKVEALVAERASGIKRGLMMERRKRAAGALLGSSKDGLRRIY
eukprot:gene1638-3134_t